MKTPFQIRIGAGLLISGETEFKPKNNKELIPFFKEVVKILGKQEIKSFKYEN
ncbi:MAG: hypothetical protein Q7R95_02380 [bacterium]|nr:hypothetical protein [bacterium]